MHDTDTKELFLDLLDNTDIHAAYMPFIKQGGLFVASADASLEIDQLVLLHINLIDEANDIIIPGKIIWLTPLGAQNNMKAGVGVQLEGEHAREVVTKMENLLAGAGFSGKRSDTL